MIDSFWIGVLGMLCILIAFLLNLIGQWKNNLRRYIAFNMIGSALLSYYAYAINSLPFLALNAVLAIASAYGLLTSARWVKKRR